jgi:hypothetical protein
MKKTRKGQGLAAVSRSHFRKVRGLKGFCGKLRAEAADGGDAELAFYCDLLTGAINDEVRRLTKKPKGRNKGRRKTTDS